MGNKFFYLILPKQRLKISEQMKNIKLALITLIFLVANACKVSEPKTPTVITPQEPATTEVAVVQKKDTVKKITLSPYVNYRASREHETDLIHTKLAVSFDWEKQYLNGTATLELKPWFYKMSNVTLDAKGFDIHSVKLVESRSKKDLKYDYDNAKLVIDLGRAYSRDENYFVEIKYTAKPNELPVGGSAAITEDKGLYFINADGSDKDKPQQIWTQGETEANSKWFPTIDTPNEKMTEEIYMTVKDEFTTLSNGVLVYSKKNGDGTRTDYWKMDLPHAPYLVMMAVGKFAVVKDSWKSSKGNIPVNYYVEPEYEQYAKAIFGNTPEMMTYFSNLLGYEYVWPKYSQVVVRDYVSGAMENTTASVFMEQLQMTDVELIDGNMEDVIAHELFHHWFGDLVTCESWSNLPLNESFADYAEYLWQEYKLGVDAADYHNQVAMDGYLAESQQKQVDMIRFEYGTPEDMFDAHSYSKGGRILHMLRKYVGDDAFFASLQHYLKKNEFKSAEIHDLRIAFEEITGEDLNWFFNQWFLSSGHPILDVKHNYKDGLLTVDVAQVQNIENTPVYKLPLKIDVWVNDTLTSYPVVIQATEEKFEFKVKEKPQLVLFDGDQQLLGVINHPKSLEENIYQYYNSGKFLSRYNALENMMTDTTAAVNKIQEVFANALDDPFWVIRDEALNMFENYEGDFKNDVITKIKKMAIEDKKSLVRATAVEVLSSIEGADAGDVMAKAIEDKSNTVKGAALGALLRTEGADKDKIIAKYLHSDDPEIISNLAMYFAEMKDYSKNDWFLKNIEVLKGEDLYYYLQSYAALMTKAPVEATTKAAPKLIEMARNASMDFIRLAAYGCLNAIPETEALKATKQDIKANEKSERLKRYYSQMGG